MVGFLFNFFTVVVRERDFAVVVRDEDMLNIKADDVDEGTF